MKKLFSLIPLVIGINLVGCNNSETAATSQPETTTATPSETETTQEVENYVSPLPDSAPTYKVAYEKASYPPFEFQDEYGKYVGYDIDLIRAIGEEAGFKVLERQLPFGDILPSLDSGDTDIAISALTVSEDRTSKYTVSDPYIKTASSYMSKQEAGITTLEKLNGLKVVTQSSGFQYNQLKDREDIELLTADTTFLAIQQLFSDKADAVFADQNVLFFLSGQFPEHPVNFVPEGESNTLAAFVKQGNQDIADDFNKGLEALIENGRYHEINQKWFGQYADDVDISK